MFKKKDPITKTTFNEYFKEVVSIKESLNTCKSISIMTLQFAIVIAIITLLGSFSPVLVAAFGELAFMPLFIISVLVSVFMVSITGYILHKYNFNNGIKMFRTYLKETNQLSFNLFDEETWPVGDDVFHTIKDMSLKDTYEIHTALSEAGRSLVRRKPVHPISNINHDL